MKPTLGSTAVLPMQPYTFVRILVRALPAAHLLEARQLGRQAIRVDVQVQARQVGRQVVIGHALGQREGGEGQLP